ncbi:MAG: BMP family ABC transporter substrate-binding protein, partial [Armatimonadota bacterium]
SCGSPPDSAHSEKAPVPAREGKAKGSGEFKVALLTPGPVNDAGWSALAFDGLKTVEREMGARVDHQEATGAKIKDAFRSYAQKGYRLVFGHGYEYNAPAVEVARDFPDTVFVTTSGAGVAKNVGAIRFNLEQSFYLAGATAALLSKSHTVGMIGGPDVPSIRSTFKAFRAGAVATDPNVKVIETFTGKDNDVAAAKQASESAIAMGADLLIHQANAAAQGVFDAAKEHKIFAFGANLNQNDNPSGVVVASATINAQPAFLDLAKRVKEGSFNGSVVLMSMNSGAIDFVFNPKLSDRVPASVRSRIEGLKAEILAGRLVVAKDKF